MQLSACRAVRRETLIDNGRKPEHPGVHPGAGTRLLWPPCVMPTVAMPLQQPAAFILTHLPKAGLEVEQHGHDSRRPRFLLPRSFAHARGHAHEIVEQHALVKTVARGNDTEMQVDERVHREKATYNKGLRRSNYNQIFSQSHYLYRQRRHGAVAEILRSLPHDRVLEIGSTAWQLFFEQNGIFPKSLTCINISERELKSGVEIARWQ